MMSVSRAMRVGGASAVSSATMRFVHSFVHSRAKRDPTAEGDGSLERMMSARTRLGRCGSVSMDRKAETRIDDDG